MAVGVYFPITVVAQSTAILDNKLTINANALLVTWSIATNNYFT